MYIKQKLATLALYGDQSMGKEAAARGRKRFTEEGKERNRQFADFQRELADIEGSAGGRYGKRMGRLHTSRARKSAYRSEKPGRSMIPFVGKGRAGAEALARIPERKRDTSYREGDAADRENAIAKALLNRAGYLEEAGRYRHSDDAKFQAAMHDAYATNIRDNTNRQK